MTDIATSLISDDEREYLILQKRAISGADDGTYEWALNEIERLRGLLLDAAFWVDEFVPPENVIEGFRVKEWRKAGEGK